MIDYENYSFSLVNYATNLSLEEIDINDEMSPFDDSIKSPSYDSDQSSRARKRYIDEIGDDYSNDDEFISPTSSTSPSSSDNDEIQDFTRKRTNKKRKTKVEPVIQSSNYSTVINQKVQSLAYQNTLVASPQHQIFKVEKPFESLPFNSYYNYTPFYQKPSSLSTEFQQAFVTGVNQTNTSTPVNPEYTEWDAINIEDLLPYLNDENLFIINDDSNYQQNKFYGMINNDYFRSENSYQFTQDHFLDDILSMIDEKSHYKR